jgi:hypothetical protein
MRDNEREKLLKQKEMVLRFLRFHHKHKEDNWENDEEYFKFIDTFLDQLNRIKEKLQQLENN